MKKQKIAIIGLGKMGEAIAQGLMSGDLAGEVQISGTTRTEESAKEARNRLKIACSTDNSDAFNDADIILLSVKPHQVEKILRANASRIHERQLLISIGAAVSTEQLSEWSGGKAAIIRRSGASASGASGSGGVGSRRPASSNR